MTGNRTMREFTGKHMLAIMIAFFGVVFAVNFTMVYFSRHSWTGLVVENSYVASQEFNEKTAAQMGDIIPVEITVYQDRSFTFICKTPPAANLLLKALGIEKGSGVPNKQKVATITQSQLLEIAKVKMSDLNAGSPEAAARIIAGTARSMGIDVVPD